LASELLIQEYADTYGLKAVINRCGVIAGPGQFGKVDQGVVSLWVANHYFGVPLKYTGFGGNGKQVRDVLHPSDLVDLLRRQLEEPTCWNCELFNIGGGRDVSVSLKEMTDLCREIVGRDVVVDGVEETARVDIPIYITDYGKAGDVFDWKPLTNVRTIISETADWIRSNEEALKPVFGVAE